MPLFNDAPQGIQAAPPDLQLQAEAAQVAVREVDLRDVQRKEQLMSAFQVGLGLSATFGRNWDALYDVLTDLEQVPERWALVLVGYSGFRERVPALADELEGVLLDAQGELGGRVWVLGG